MVNGTEHVVNICEKPPMNEYVAREAPMIASQAQILEGLGRIVKVGRGLHQVAYPKIVYYAISKNFWRFRSTEEIPHGTRFRVGGSTSVDMKTRRREEEEEKGMRLIEEKEEELRRLKEEEEEKERICYPRLIKVR